MFNVTGLKPEVGAFPANWLEDNQEKEAYVILNGKDWFSYYLSVECPCSFGSCTCENFHGVDAIYYVKNFNKMMFHGTRLCYTGTKKDGNRFHFVVRKMNSKKK